MPELPEVETVCRGLRPVVVGQTITRAELRRPDLRFPFPDDFAAQLAGRRIEALERRAKYLVAELSGGLDLIMHLGMTGRFSIVREAAREATSNYVYGGGAKAAHDHVVLVLKDGTHIVYNDARRFGFMLLVPRSRRAEHPLFAGLGVEPLASSLTAQALALRAQGRKTNLKAFLMDQRNVAGLGNIYVSEALHLAGLSPKRGAATLALRNGRPSAQAQALVPAIRKVLMKAVAAQGATLRDYRQADGSRGAMQDGFRVYDRAGEPCLRPGCGGTVRRIVQANRATFYCPRCQR